MTKLRVPVEPLGEPRWERIERRVLDRERPAASGVLAPRQERLRSRNWPFALAAAGWAVAAVAIVFFVVAGESKPVPQARVDHPARIATPPGGSTRVELGDAAVALSGDTAVETRVDADGSIRVDLLRGRIACDVAPRPGRAAFAVIAGDVTVSVIGTAFTVEKDEDVRVSVERGHVKVARGEVTTSLLAGDRWTASQGRLAALDDPTPNPAPNPTPDPNPNPNPNPTLGSGSRDPEPGAPETPDPRDPGPRKKGKPFVPATTEDLEKAQSLEKTDLDEAIRRYKGLAQSSDTIADKALYRLADLTVRHNGKANARTAIDATREYMRRFPRGRHRSDMMLLQIRAYVLVGDMVSAHTTARAFARDYRDEMWRLDGLNLTP